MEACTVETGLLRKKPCGQSAIAKCANCEQPLCSKHAVAQTTTTGRKTGAFLCGECHAAQRAYERNFGANPVPATPAAAQGAAPKPASPGAAPKPAAKPPGAASAAPVAKAPAPQPAAAPPAKPDEDSLGTIEFTPEKK